MEEVKEWLAQAEKDLRAARNSLKAKEYGWAAFQANQAAEKALKALYILKFKRLLKIHDLPGLGQSVGAPSNVLKCCAALNPHYIRTRYVFATEYGFEEASAAIRDCRTVIAWAKKALKK